MARKLLVDTSAWVEHFKGKTNKVAIAALDERTVLVSHPMVLAELALGGVAANSEVMKHLKELRGLSAVSHLELMEFIEKRGLRGRGIGYVDANLLASCLLNQAELLSFDHKLNNTASIIEVSIYQK